VLEQLTERIYSACGEKFNINSTQQLSKILFGETQSYRGKKDKDRLFNGRHGTRRTPGRPSD